MARTKSATIDRFGAPRRRATARVCGRARSAR